MVRDLRNELGKHKGTFEDICEKVSKIFYAPLHRDFTDHKPEGHSARIVKIFDSLCAEIMETDKKLNEDEIFILLASAYVHDVGMQYEKDKTLTLMGVREKHHELSAEMILGSVQRPKEFRDLGISREYVDEIAKVSRGHRKTELKSPDYDPVVIGDKTIRLRLLAALLSLADDLDLTHNRVDMENLKLRSVPQESRVHWWRCHYVEGVQIENGRIRIFYKFPSKLSNESAKLIAASIQEQLEKNMNANRDILWDNYVKLCLDESKFGRSSSKEMISAQDLRYLKSRLSGTRTDGRRIEREASDFLGKAHKTIGLNTKYRYFGVTLKWEKRWVGVLKGEIKQENIVRNETDEAKLLFQDGKVLDGLTTIPEAVLQRPPRAIENIVTFEGLQISGKRAAFVKKIDYVNPSDKKMGIRREIQCRKKIPGKSTRRIAYLERFLFEKDDTFTRRFKYLSLGLLEMYVWHPIDIKEDTIWLSSPESELQTKKTVISSTLTLYSAQGKWMPGDGFLLSWRKG